MKKKLLLIIFLACCIATHAKRTVICGRYDYKPEEKSYIQFYSSTVDIINHTTTRYTSKPDKKGNFKFVFDTDIPLSFVFYNGDKLLFYNHIICPGDSLTFTFKDNSTSISGNCEECEAFQFALNDKFFSGSALDEYHKSFRDYEPKAFAEYQNNLRIAQRDFFESHFKDKNCPSLFRQEMLNDIDYNYCIDIVQYGFRGKYGKTALNDSTYIPYVFKVLIDNPNALCGRHYIHFLRELPYCMWLS